MIRRASLFAAAFVTTTMLVTPVSAQRAGRWTLGPRYSVVLPTGQSTRNFADGLSFRGGTLDIERGVSDRAAVGLSLGWHVLTETNASTSTLPDGAVSGSALRYVNAVPLLATASLALGSRSGLQPWFGVGGGTAWVENRTETGLLRTEATNWHPAAMGEVGLRIPRGGGRTLTAGVRYQRAFDSNAVEREYLTFSLGVLLGG